MAPLDCFLIGHNEIGISRHNQLLRLLYGKHSKNYSETAKYNLSHVRCEDGYYTPSQIFNLADGQEGTRTDIADTFSLTIAYLGSYLHRHGFTFDYVNTFHKASDQAKLAHYLETGLISSVAITTTYYLTILPVLDIVKFVKRWNPDVKIIIGGPFIHNQVRALPEEDLQRQFAALRADYYVDSNEGEDTFGRLLAAIKHGLPLDTVNNIYYQQGGRYVGTPKSPEANDLNEHTVEWGLFASDIKDIVNIRTTKSCPFKCSFCSFPGAAGRYRVMDLDLVERELNALARINPRLGLDIIDDTFNIPKGRFKELLRMMIRNRYEFRWYAFYKAQLADRETAKLMAEAGCVQVFAGCESGSQIILDNLDKQSQLEKYYEAFDLLHEFGLLSIASFIVGFPGETEDTYRETIDFIEKTEPTFFRARLWWYDRTAPVYHQRERFQLEGDGYEWRHYTMDSNQAQKLADAMVMGIRNSTHATDYPIPFEMIIKGVDIESVKQFMARFRKYLDLNITDPFGKHIFERRQVVDEFRQILHRTPGAGGHLDTAIATPSYGHH
jgi:anaerobic magnesium-protoporphyrin IX monomethyl ester cyclase